MGTDRRETGRRNHRRTTIRKGHVLIPFAAVDGYGGLGPMARPRTNTNTCSSSSDFTRKRCSGRRRGLSCSAECPLHAYGSIGLVRGLRRPQTTIDASSVVDLSAPMCSRPSHEQFFLSRVSLLQAADVAGNRISRIRTAPPPGGGDGPGGGAARFAMMSSVETAATWFNDSVGRSVGLSTSYPTSKLHVDLWDLELTWQ
ncbi:hypothetical protein THAOC_02745, partial [Thalassiosira oceanica]